MPRLSSSNWRYPLSLTAVPRYGPFWCEWPIVCRLSLGRKEGRLRPSTTPCMHLQPRIRSHRGADWARRRQGLCCRAALIGQQAGEACSQAPTCLQRLLELLGRVSKGLVVIFGLVVGWAIFFRYSTRIQTSGLCKVPSHSSRPICCGVGNVQIANPRCSKLCRAAIGASSSCRGGG